MKYLMVLALFATGFYLVGSSDSQRVAVSDAVSVAGYMRNTETLGWAPTPNAAGYQLLRDGTTIATAGPGATSTRFSVSSGTHTLEVRPTFTTTTTTTAPTTTMVPTTTTAPTTTTIPTTTSSGSALGANCTSAQGAINLAAGSYSESVTCELPCGVSLTGAGGRNGATTILGTADPLIEVKNCTSGTSQTISGLHLDGQNRTAGRMGLRVTNVNNLTISDLDVENFKGPATQDVNTDGGGGAININGAVNLDLGNSILRNSGSITSGDCTGTLGLANLSASTIHDLTVSDATAYAIKDGADPTTLSNVTFDHLNATIGSTGCSMWNTLDVELFDTTATNVVIENSTFNGVVSLTDPGTGSTLPSGYRYDIHNNVWTILSGSEYAIELDNDSSHVHNNYFNGGLYPVANFTSDAKINNIVDHNVFDNEQGPVACWHYPSGVTNGQFFNNTIVLRGTRLCLNFGSAGGTIAVHDNIFTATSNVGDQMCSGCGQATVDHNAFFNLTAHGTNVVAGTALPLTGGFPAAYTPSSGSAEASLGAFASGSFTVG